MDRSRKYRGRGTGGRGGGGGRGEERQEPRLTPSVESPRRRAPSGVERGVASSAVSVGSRRPVFTFHTKLFSSKTHSFDSPQQGWTVEV